MNGQGQFARGAFTLLICAGSLPSLQGSSAERLFFSRDSGKVLSRAVVIPPDQFSLSALELTARRFMDGPAAGKSIAQLALGTDEGALSSSLFHGRGTEGNSDLETRLSLANTTMPVPLARVLVVKGQGVLWLRDKSGFRQKVLHAGPDPTKFRVGGHSMRLLQIALTEPGPALPKDAYSLVAYIQCEGSISAKAVKKLTAVFFVLSAVDQLRLEVSPHAYFFEDFDFPAVFPFQPILTLPTPKQAKSPRARCSVGRNINLGCVGVGLTP